MGDRLLQRVKDSTLRPAAVFCAGGQLLPFLVYKHLSHTSEYPIHLDPQTLSILKKVGLRLWTLHLLIFGNPVSKLLCQTLASNIHVVGRTGDVW